MHRRRLVVGNWKMNGRLNSGVQLALDLVRKCEATRPENVDMAIAPPFPLLWPISEVTIGSPVHLAGQDCHVETHGAFTGDVSAAMLADVGCRYAIVGHSERRRDHGESDALVAKKMQAAQLAGLTAIVCVGESRDVRDSGHALEHVTAQVKALLHVKHDAALLVIAYEPIWAIGTGLTPLVADIAQMHSAIRSTLGGAGANTRILYGGSVTPQSAEGIIKENEVDGFLVGGASLNADGFWQIVQLCHGKW